MQQLPKSLIITTLHHLLLFNSDTQAQVLPKNTKGELFFSNQEGLDVSKNKVQSRPKIGKQL